ncbi:MAG TPA: CHAD domain-containing protein [Terriglobales bacterium]
MAPNRHHARHQRSGLAYWMEQVLTEADKAARGFAADPVHDLRVALRRCRSMAEGLRAIDPDPSWKKMRKMGKDLFSSLGELRDCQVLMEWTENLGETNDSVVASMLGYCRVQEHALKQNAEAVLHRFDRKQWEVWSRSLMRRSARLHPGSEPFQSLALERWTQARRLHRLAMKTDNPSAFHRLRIGLKKFRYVVENFLPERHQQWGQGLKHIQDLLGEIHDLDVLRATLLRSGVLADPSALERWQQRVDHERKTRVEAYCREMAGPDSLWQVWRSGLPRGPEARSAAFRKFQVWASYLDPDVAHSRRVARLALQLHDGLARAGLLGHAHEHSREYLQAAATVHEVGRSAGRKGHHKNTERLVREVDRPFSWTRQDLEVIAFIARYHRGALPGRSPNALGRLRPEQRRLAQLLAGILRLANAFDAGRDGTIRRVKVSLVKGEVVVYAGGLDNRSELAERIAGARHLLELSCGLAVLVRPLPRRLS